MKIEQMVGIWARVLTSQEINVLYEYERYYFMNWFNKVRNVLKHIRLRRRYQKLQGERVNK